jgi:peroxiredoxin (alkyl hydroperoxide reductase subunit C)
MKNLVKVFLAHVLLVMGTGYAKHPLSLIGQKAPDFKAQAVVDGEIKDISLSDYEGKNKILIFYPADFSFICPTELFAFQEKLPEFEKKNTVLIALSVDQVYSHQAWLEKSRNQGGIKGITYPILSDITRKISKDYMTFDEKDGVDFRGVFIIDKDNIIQALSVYNLDIGRDVTEPMRVLDAIQFIQEHGKVCPANWHKGQEGLEKTQDGLKKYLNDTDKTVGETDESQ